MIGIGSPYTDRRSVNWLRPPLAASRLSSGRTHARGVRPPPARIYAGDVPDTVAQLCGIGSVLGHRRSQVIDGAVEMQAEAGG